MKKIILLAFCILCLGVFVACGEEELEDSEAKLKYEFGKHYSKEELDSLSKMFKSYNKELPDGPSQFFLVCEINKYDDKGNLLYYKERTGYNRFYEGWFEYDDKGNKIYQKSKNSVGEWEIRYEYEKGKVVRENSGGSETFYEYDKKGNLIYKKTWNEKSKTGEERWYEYDKNGNRIYEKSDHTTHGIYEQWYEYDNSENIIYEKTSSGREKWYEYDKKGNLIYKKESDGEYPLEYFYEYDKDGNKIHEKEELDGYEKWYEYDKNGNLVYEKNDDYGRLTETWYEYDSKGNITYLKESRQMLDNYSRIDLKLYEYEFYKNGKIKSMVIFETFWDEGKNVYH